MTIKFVKRSTVSDFFILIPNDEKIELKDLIKKINLDLKNVKSAADLFLNCQNLEEVNIKNAENITSTSNMFYGCKKLREISEFNINNISGTSAYDMFGNCPSLSNNSLNKILNICKNFSLSNKTLKYIGLSETQATTCTTLSNWANCEAAGWTTGY